MCECVYMCVCTYMMWSFKIQSQFSFFFFHFKGFFKNQKYRLLDFPGSPVVGRQPANAGDTCSMPGLVDPTCKGQLRPRATTTEPAHPRACSPQLERPLLTATRGSPHAATETQHSHKHAHEWIKRDRLVIQKYFEFRKCSSFTCYVKTDVKWN